MDSPHKAGSTAVCVKCVSEFQPHTDFSTQVRQQTSVVEVCQKQSCQSALLSVSLRRPLSLLPHSSILPLLPPACPSLRLLLLHTHTHTRSHIIISLWAFVILHLFSTEPPFHSAPHLSHTDHNTFFVFCIFCPLSVFPSPSLSVSPWLTLVFTTTVAHLTFPLSLY